MIALNSFIALAITLGVVHANATPTVFGSRIPQSTIEPALTAVIGAQATQTAISPTSDVEGLVFGRFVQIWLENLVGYVSFPHSE
jgi:acid phosphatase